MGLLDDLLRGGAGMGRTPRPHPTSMGGNANMSRVLMTLLPIVLSMLAQRRRQGTPQQSDLGPGMGGGNRGGGLGDILGGMLGGGGPLGGGTANAPGGGILGGLLER